MTTRIIVNTFERIVIEVDLGWQVKPVFMGLPHKSTEIKLNTKLVTYAASLREEPCKK